jgi:hypothetical protein
MRKLLIFIAMVSISIAASAITVTAQVTGIRHSDGSWTFVDANGRDIHKDYDARRAAQRKDRTRTSQRHRDDHKVTGYLPWQSR